MRTSSRKPRLSQLAASCLSRPRPALHTTYFDHAAHGDGLPLDLAGKAAPPRPRRPDWVAPRPPRPACSRASALAQAGPATMGSSASDTVDPSRPPGKRQLPLAREVGNGVHQAVAQRIGRTDQQARRPAARQSSTETGPWAWPLGRVHQPGLQPEQAPRTITTSSMGLPTLRAFGHQRRSHFVGTHGQRAAASRHKTRVMPCVMPAPQGGYDLAQPGCGVTRACSRSADRGRVTRRTAPGSSHINLFQRHGAVSPRGGAQASACACAINASAIAGPGILGLADL